MNNVKLPAFLLSSLLFIAAPLTLMFRITLQTGGWSEALPVIPHWLALCIFYWRPLGAFLFNWRGRTWARLLYGYLLSIPLYFITLALVYPAFGATFHPLIDGRWKIYLSATPQFYLMVLALWFITTRRFAPWMVRLAMVVFAAGILIPFYLAAKTSFDWPKSQPAEIAITGAHLVDAPSNRILDGQTVYIQSGRIVEVGPVSSHPGWPRIDAAGRYLIPGMIDVHTHLQSPVEVRTGFSFGYLMESMFSGYEPQRRAYLESGVTTIRDLGGPASKSFQMRAAILHRKMLGPHLLTSGRLVTSPHGHPVSTIWNASISREGAIIASNEKTMLDGLDHNLAEGPPDVVKFVHGTIGRAHEELTADLLARGIRWATDHRLPSVVHTETNTEFDDAVRANATGIEHAAYLETLSPATLASVSQHRPFVDPTFGEYETDLMLKKTSKPQTDAILAQKYAIVRQLRDAGARLVIGTDAPMVAYGSGFHDELDHFTHAGFAPAEILAMATAGNAAGVGRANELGAIAAGYRADLVLVNENPLQDLHTLRTPAWTMLDGQIVVVAPAVVSRRFLLPGVGQEKR